MATFMQTIAATKVHKKRILEVNAWVQAEVSDWKPETLLENLKDLIFLNADLPADAFTEVVSQGKAKLKEYWAASFAKLSAGEPGVECKLMQDILAEACSSWPDEQYFLDMTSELAELLSSKAGRALVQKFLASWTALGGCCSDPEQVEQSFPSLEATAAAARGVALPADTVQPFQAVFQEVVAEMAKQVKKNYDGFSVLFKAVSCGEAWWSAEQKATMQSVKLTHQLYEGLRDFEGEMKDVECMLKAEKAEAKLTVLMRLVQEAQCVLDEPADHQWSHDLLTPSFESSKVRVVEATLQMYTEAERNIKSAIDMAGCAKGMPGGKSWLEGVSDEWAWETLVEHAEMTLLKVPKADLEKLKSTLTQETRE